MTLPTRTESPIVALFASQKEAGAALRELNRLELESDSIHVVETAGSEPQGWLAVPALNTPAGPGVIPGLSPLPLEAGDRTAHLTNLGVPAAEADYYASAIERGAVLLVVDADGDRRHRARRLLANHGATKLQEPTA